jgi:hypothetical protein
MSITDKYLINIRNIEFPANERYNFKLLAQSILNRHYASFISRLQHAGYSFPAPNHYREQFEIPEPASFLATDELGLAVQPGYNYRWLVFHLEEGHPVFGYIARQIVQEGANVVLFGDHPQGMYIKLGSRDVLEGVAVPLTSIDALLGPAVIKI